MNSTVSKNVGQHDHVMRKKHFDWRFHETFFHAVEMLAAVALEFQISCMMIYIMPLKCNAVSRRFQVTIVA